MVKPLTFKGDKKPKKRKREAGGRGDGDGDGDDDNGDPQQQQQKKKTARLNPAANDDGTILANAEDGGGNGVGDDGWVSADAVSDVGGPVMLVLPTWPPSALACDAAGKVFCIPVENIVDGNPSSAEPHDVRQVWVATKMPGTENFRFKGHHGKVLSCDKFGILSATSEAVSPLESFVLVPATESGPSTFQIQTLRETYLTVKDPSPASSSKTAEVRGDATESAAPWRIRMQARFKPRLKAEKAEKAREKITRAELEAAVGRRLEEHEVKKLKRARREGDYHEMLLDLKVKGKHDKYG